MAAPQTVPVQTPEVGEVTDLDRAWVTIVWNDPVNLMSYVTWVFQKLFGYSREKAEKLMLDVHHKGKAIVSSGARERMEYDATRLHGYGLWATVDFWGARKQVRLDVVDQPVAPGDYVLNHVGYAIRRIAAEDIGDTLALYDELLRAAGADDDLMAADVRGELHATGREGGDDR